MCAVCSACVAIRDPYCSWLSSGQCAHSKNGYVPYDHITATLEYVEYVDRPGFQPVVRRHEGFAAGWQGVNEQVEKICLKFCFRNTYFLAHVFCCIVVWICDWCWNYNTTFSRWLWTFFLSVFFTLKPGVLACPSGYLRGSHSASTSSGQDIDDEIYPHLSLVKLGKLQRHSQVITWLYLCSLPSLLHLLLVSLTDRFALMCRAFCRSASPLNLSLRWIVKDFFMIEVDACRSWFVLLSYLVFYSSIRQSFHGDISFALIIYIFVSRCKTGCK